MLDLTSYTTHISFELSLMYRTNMVFKVPVQDMLEITTAIIIINVKKIIVSQNH